MNELAQVTAWLMGAIMTWAPGVGEEVSGRAAWEIVDVAYDGAEPPLYRGEMARARSALTVAITAADESGFREDVQAGHCKPWECDHGDALCWMQVHARPGIVFVGDEWRYARKNDVGVLLPASLLDEETCFRVGMRMLRSSLLHTGSLRGYTGERGKAPIARAREQRVLKYLRDFPPPVEDSEALATAD